MIGYYPGCSLHGTGKEYERSLRLVARTLAVELAEVPDWLCCGASSAHAVDRHLALALAGDTLAKARDAGLTQVLAPCAMCYSRLAAVAHEFHETPALADRVDRALGPPPGEPGPAPARGGLGGVQALSVLDWLRALPDEAIARPLTRPLQGLKVAAYYGCLLARPQELTGPPGEMERVLRLLGAEPVPWAMASECCGGSFALSDKPAVLRQGKLLVEHARAAGAEALVVACPMCQANLDMRQGEFAPEASPLPVLYLTQLMALAYGASEEDLGLRGHFVSPTKLLARVEG